jgi:hypothetical protein
MAQTSRFWTTNATPSGDQQASYSGADFADVWRAMGEGVISGHSLPALDGELACSDGGANTVDVADGAAIVDGIYFESTAVENVNVPSAVGAGNTRIDRIVVRVTWASYDAAITRIAGTDAASPAAPAITQTSESTYDLPLCQVLVDTSGNVTVTDERDWFAPQTDDVTLEVDQTSGDLQVKDAGIDTAQLAADAVTTAKIVDANVTEAKIGAGAVTTAKIADANVTPAKTSFLDMMAEDAQIYIGVIGSDGVSIKLPTGWSCSRTSAPGEYRLTHNLGKLTYVFVATSTTYAAVYGVARNTDYVDYETRDSSGALINALTWFILIVYD